jgi:hypothetical protein
MPAKSAALIGCTSSGTDPKRLNGDRRPRQFVFGAEAELPVERFAERCGVQTQARFACECLERGFHQKSADTRPPGIGVHQHHREPAKAAAITHKGNRTDRDARHLRDTAASV